MALKEKILDRAQKFIQKGAIDKAIAEYKSAFELDPKDTSIRLRIGDLYIKIGKKDVAIKEYTEAAKANTQRGFYLKAIAVYKQILKIEPTNLDVHNKLAELYTKQRLIADAVSEYSFIVTVFERNGKVQETVELLKKMVDIDPENIGVRLKLAELHHRRSFKNDALAEYAWIFDRLMSQGKHDKAEKIYLGLANSYPGEPEVLERLAGLYMAGGKGAEFYKYASRLFDIYKNSGDTEKARATCQSILEVRPDDAASLAYLSRPEVKERPAITAPSFEMPTREPVSKEDSRSAEVSPRTPQPVKQAAPPPAVIEEEPEEEIEIALEGFEEAGEEAAKEEAGVEAPYSPAASKEETVPDETVHEGAEVKGGAAKPDSENEVEFELGSGAMISEPEEDAVTEPVSSEEPVQTEGALGESGAKPEEEASPVTEVAEATEEYVLNETDQHVSEIASVAESSGHEGAEEAVIAEAEELESGVAEEPGFAIQQEAEEPRYAGRKESAETEESVEPVIESEDVQEDISKAISELMEKIEPEGDASVEKGGIEEAIEEIAAESGENEEYVDLTAELGMKETVENLAESWGKEESKETFDEFKSGIVKQLNKEDSETHYNLGIAYMEMELFGEAVKEFKIALKDAHLEFDCYTRLGLCYMSMSYPDDAILSYLKGLRVQGKSDEERRGMMYELALAYEFTGKKDLAYQLFKSIYDISPDYREVSKKVKAIAPAAPAAAPAREKERPFMPLDDGLIEVELL